MLLSELQSKDIINIDSGAKIGLSEILKLM